LEVEEGGGDGGSGGECEENDEEAAAVGKEEAAQDAAEHGAVGGTLIHANTRTLDPQKTWLAALTLRSFGYPRRVASG